MEHARCAKLKLGVEGEAMDMNFLKAHAERCRSLAENADEFTKRRLLDLSASGKPAAGRAANGGEGRGSKTTCLQKKYCYFVFLAVGWDGGSLASEPPNITHALVLS